MADGQKHFLALYVENSNRRRTLCPSYTWQTLWADICPGINTTLTTWVVRSNWILQTYVQSLSLICWSYQSFHKVLLDTAQCVHTFFIDYTFVLFLISQFIKPLSHNYLIIEKKLKNGILLLCMIGLLIKCKKKKKNFLFKNLVSNKL